jgi:hypothetical protein
LLVCTILYLIPPTCVLGAILLTGYHGAVATHVRVGDSLFGSASGDLGALLWEAVTRDGRLRALLPLRT